jgi:hypothetical protein
MGMSLLQISFCITALVQLDFMISMSLMQCVHQQSKNRGEKELSRSIRVTNYEQELV